MQTNDIYNTCLDISNVLNAGDISNARSKVITLLHEINGTNNNSYMELVNHLIREVGLLPYIDTYTASWEDRFVCEVFKVNIGERKPCVLHTAQSQVLKKLLEGKSVAVSAPTSFGKSFVIDAFIAIKQPINVVILVPTVALADETRRRICRKFSHQYKIITTTDVELAEKNICLYR